MAWVTTSAVLLMLLAGYAVSVDNYPPVLKSILLNGEASPSVIFPSTSDMTIRCQSEGGTPIWWRVPGAAQRFVQADRLVIQTKELVYGGPEAFDGSYSCFTNNTLGTALSSPIQLDLAVVKLAAAKAAVRKLANLGETVTLSCHSEQSSEVRPSSLDLEIKYVWYWQILNPGPSGFGFIDFDQMYTLTQGRIAVDEKNVLYIRNVQPSDFNSTTYAFIGCRAFPGTYHTAGEVIVGMYTLGVTGTNSPQPPLALPTLRYSTAQVTVIEGGKFTLACIFDEVNGILQGNVNWNNAFSLSLDQGARVQINNASQQHNGTWECNYKGVKGTINVFVKLYPRLTGIQDNTFATVGDTVTFTCNYKHAVSLTWYKNNEIVDILGRVAITRRSDNSEEMKLLNVRKSDVAVYSCEVRNDFATFRRNGRLIVTDPTVVNASVNDGEKLVGTVALVDSNTTKIKIGCIFSADPLISNPSIVWRMQQFSQNIIETTEAPEYGISKGNVITQVAAKQSSLTISVNGDSSSKVIGNVTCILMFKILDREFSTSSNSVEIKQKEEFRPPETIKSAQFPYWIIGVIIAALFLILLVFLIIFCVQRNKGEQYYVDEKERKAGHDPKEELPPWQEFNRPDQDPVKGSRASLEMEGDRPMGSDAGSMDEYGVDTDTGKFNEDGSFIGQYGPKGQRSGASGQV